MAVDLCTFNPRALSRSHTLTRSLCGEKKPRGSLQKTTSGSYEAALGRVGVSCGGRVAVMAKRKAETSSPAEESDLLTIRPLYVSLSLIHAHTHTHTHTHTQHGTSNDAAFYENKCCVCCVGVDHIQRKSVHDSRNQGHLPLAPLRLYQSQVSPSLSIHLSLYLFLRTLIVASCDY